MEINFKDEMKALILMSSLLELWDTVVAMINRSRRYEKLKFDNVRDVVFSESIHKQKIGDLSDRAFNVDRRRSKLKGPNNKTYQMGMWGKWAFFRPIVQTKKETRSQIWR